jgi:hypothetical protein
MLSFFVYQLSKIKSKPKTPVYVPDSFTLIGIGELKCIIEVRAMPLLLEEFHAKQHVVKSNNVDKNNCIILVL